MDVRSASFSFLHCRKFCPYTTDNTNGYVTKWRHMCLQLLWNSSKEGKGLCVKIHCAWWDRQVWGLDYVTMSPEEARKPPPMPAPLKPSVEVWNHRGLVLCIHVMTLFWVPTMCFRHQHNDGRWRPSQVWDPHWVMAWHRCSNLRPSTCWLLGCGRRRHIFKLPFLDCCDDVNKISPPRAVKRLVVLT